MRGRRLEWLSTISIVKGRSNFSQREALDAPLKWLLVATFARI